MRSLSRRIADGHVLSVVKQWLRAPVVEPDARGERRTTEASDANRGTPQGGVISPLLANIYFRRFILAWKKFGYGERLQACIVNYADDAKTLAAKWRLEYNHRRPHLSLKYLPPAMFAATLAVPPVGAAPLPPARPACSPILEPRLS